MPIPVELPPTFTRALDHAPLIGAWICSGSQVAAEIVASAGFDWLLIDGEHSPYSLETMRVGPYTSVARSNSAMVSKL